MEMSRGKSMLSVEEALARITAAFKPLPAETVGLAEALGRVLAEAPRICFSSRFSCAS